MFYPVTLTKDDNGTILVTFPDVPEAVTFGDTPEEALARAQDALLTIFDAFMKDRRDIPSPSPAAGTGVMLPALESTKIALYQAMRASKVNKSQLAKRLDWHLPQVDRVLNVRHGSQLDQIEAALAAVGKRLVVDTADLEPVTLTVRGSAISTGRRVRVRRQAPVHSRRLARAGEKSRNHAGAGRSSALRKIAAKKR